MDDSRYTPPKSSVADVRNDTDAEAQVPDAVLKKIRNAWVACIVSGVLTVILAMIAMNGNSMGGHSGYDVIDALFVFGLAFGISRKSRVCAVLMLAYFVLSKYLLFRASGQVNGLAFGVVFLYFYAMGVQGTFEYHKLRKG